MAALWFVVEAPPLRGSTVEQISYVEADSSQAAAETLPGSTVVGGPYASQAAAQQAFPGTQTTSPLDRGTAPASGAAPGTINATPSQLPSFSLLFSGISTWFFRALKVVFGGLLITLGVSHLTGVSNQLTRAAGNAVPLLAAAA